MGACIGIGVVGTNVVAKGEGYGMRTGIGIGVAFGAAIVLFGLAALIDKSTAK